MVAADLTASCLRELLSYDPSTGVFERYVRPRNAVRLGNEAGGCSADGYRVISVCGVRYYAHRLAWLYVTGKWPIGEIDHIDGDRSNNRLCNLRDTSRSINAQNMRTAKSHNQFSHLLGATWSKQHRKWRARIKIGNRFISLGLHATCEAAHVAYVSAKRSLHAGNML